MRIASVKRETNETKVEVYVNIDGTGEASVDTGISFLNHLVETLSLYSLIDIKVKSTYTDRFDEHHIAEDTAITLGKAIDQALGDRKGIGRFGFSFIPMDDTLAFAAVDLGGRPYLKFKGEFLSDRIGDLSSYLIRHILESLAYNGRMNIHARIIYGLDDHHKAEALFKALGKALRYAAESDKRVADKIMSRKGVLR
jgi:imidazoleglycerol-phosphate dehydratase